MAHNPTPSAPPRGSWLERLTQAGALLDDADSILKSEQWTPSDSHAHVRKLTAPLRPAVKYEWAHSSDLQRDWDLDELRWGNLLESAECDASSLAVHEAGHLVVAETFLKPGAVIAASIGRCHINGLTRWEGTYRDRAKGLHPLPKVAILAAGTMAELIAQGGSWDRPIVCSKSDWACATAEIQARKLIPNATNRFHAYAQKHALKILAHRWFRVLDVAEILLQRGSFTTTIEPGPETEANAFEWADAIE